MKVLYGFLVGLLITGFAIGGEPASYVSSLEDAVALSEHSKKDILLIFTASWCQPCQNLKKDLKDNPEIIENLIVCYVDIDENQDLAKQYKARTVPKYFLISNRIEVKSGKGYKSLKNLKEWLNN
jgi:thioredoxin-like negative regulator of GroEL